MRKRLGTSALLIGSVLGSLLLGEWLLRELTLFPIHGPHGNRIPDPRLYYRTSPVVSGVDQDGFRNERALGTAQIAAIGDSHTYGYNVRSEESWPAVLGRSLGRSVYNFGTGSYNLVQYAALVEDAVAKSPELIAVGFYPNNDLNGFCQILNLPYWRSRRDLLGIDASHCEDRLTRPFGEGDGDHRPLLRRLADGSAWLSALRYWSGIGSPQMADWTLLRHHDAAFRPYSKSARKRGAFAVEIDGRSVFVPPRSVIRAPQPPAVAIGLRLFRHMQQVSGELGIAFRVLVIPSPYLVVYTALAQRDLEAPTELEREVAAERSAIQTFEAYFDRVGIAYVDASPFVARAFSAALARDEVFYPDPGWDHPLAAGQAAYARAFQSAIAAEERGP